MARDTLNELLSILAEERQALLCARYDALPAIAVAKDLCLQELSRMPFAKSALFDVKKKVDENQNLITAALRGVDAARKRIAALEDVRDVLTTYGPSGKVSVMPNAKNTIEKKA